MHLYISPQNWFSFVWNEHFEEAIFGLADRVAKDAITQIIEALTQESVKQSLKGTTESN